MAQKQPSHEGHRQRMYKRVEQYGFDSLEEHEALEILLYFTHARGNTNLLAHALIDRFGSFAAVLDAPPQELCTVQGVGPTTARMLHLLPAVSRYYRRSRVKKQGRLDTTQKLGQYLLAQFHGMREEKLLALALDDRLRPVHNIWLDTGTAGSVNADVYRLASGMVHTGSTLVVLAHNHPGGLALPSRSDVVATGEIMRALAVLGVHVRDHVIVSEDEYYSMLDHGSLPFYDFKTGELHFR